MSLHYLLLTLLSLLYFCEINALSCWCNVQTADIACVKPNRTVILPSNAFGYCKSDNPTLACLQKITWPWPQEYACEENESAKAGVFEYTVLNGELHTYVNYCNEDLCQQQIHPASCAWRVSPVGTIGMTSLTCSCNSGENCQRGRCTFEGRKIGPKQFPFCRYSKIVGIEGHISDCFVGDSAEDRQVFRDSEQQLLLCRDMDLCNHAHYIYSIFDKQLHCLGMKYEETTTTTTTTTTRKSTATTTTTTAKPTTTKSEMREQRQRNTNMNPKVNEEINPAMDEWFDKISMHFEEDTERPNSIAAKSSKKPQPTRPLKPETVTDKPKATVTRKSKNTVTNRPKPESTVTGMPKTGYNKETVYSTSTRPNGVLWTVPTHRPNKSHALFSVPIYCAISAFMIVILIFWE